MTGPMKNKAYGEEAAEKLLPLLLSIGREIKHRVKAVNEMEEALEGGVNWW